MNNFIKEKIGFYNFNLYYADTEGLHIEKIYWVVLAKANLVGKKLCQSRNY